MISTEELTIISAEVTRRIMSSLRDFIPEQDERYEFQLAPTQDRPGVILHFKSNSKPWPEGVEAEIRAAIPRLVAAAGPALKEQERTGLYDGYLAWVVRPRSESKYLAQIGMSKAEIKEAVTNLHRSRLSARLSEMLKKYPIKPAVSRSLISVDWPQQKDTISP